MLKKTQYAGLMLGALMISSVAPMMAKPDLSGIGFWSGLWGKKSITASLLNPVIFNSTEELNSFRAASGREYMGTWGNWGLKALGLGIATGLVCVTARAVWRFFEKNKVQSPVALRPIFVERTDDTAANKKEADAPKCTHEGCNNSGTHAKDDKVVCEEHSK